MISDLLSIGELAHRSRLSITAVRYYADTGVLVPHHIDPTSGYRYFRGDQLRDACLLHELRKLGLPVRVLRDVLRDGPEAIWAAVDERQEELRRAVAHSEEVIANVKQILRMENPMTNTTQFTTRASALRDAIARVRPAIGGDDERPVLMCVLLEVEGSTLRIVATDSYRLAIAEVVGERDGADGAWAVPGVSLVHALESAEAGDTRLNLSETDVFVSTASGEHSLPVQMGYPDYQRLLTEMDELVAQVELELPDTTDALRAAEQARPGEWVALEIGDGVCRFVTAAGPIPVTGSATGGALRVGARLRFLLDAVKASIGPDLIIDVRGPTSPLVVRSATDGSFTTLVMPMTLHAPADA